MRHWEKGNESDYSMNLRLKTFRISSSPWEVEISLWDWEMIFYILTDLLHCNRWMLYVKDIVAIQSNTGWMFHPPLDVTERVFHGEVSVLKSCQHRNCFLKFLQISEDDRQSMKYGMRRICDWFLLHALDGDRKTMCTKNVNMRTRMSQYAIPHFNGLEPCLIDRRCREWARISQLKYGIVMITWKSRGLCLHNKTFRSCCGDSRRHTHWWCRVVLDVRIYSANSSIRVSIRQNWHWRVKIIWNITWRSTVMKILRKDYDMFPTNQEVKLSITIQIRILWMRYDLRVFLIDEIGERKHISCIVFVRFTRTGEFWCLAANHQWVHFHQDP